MAIPAPDSTRALPATQALTVVTIYLCVFLAAATALALLGSFTGWFVAAYATLGAWLLLGRRGTALRGTIRRHAGILTLVALWAGIVAATTVPTVLTGRDQGSIATAAILLADHGTLTHHTPASDAFFGFYGPGKALNFPGFFYAEDGALVSQFPLPYTVWLASGYIMAGLGGLVAANAALLALTILLLAAVTRLVVPATVRGVTRRAATLAVALAVASFPLMWFARHTLTENLAQALLLAMILQLLLLRRALGAAHRDDATVQRHYWLLLGTGALLTFTRIEGGAFFGIAAFAILASRHGGDWLRDRFLSHILVPSVGLLLLLAVAFDASTGFYKSVAKALLGIGDATPAAVGIVTTIMERHVAYAVYGITPLLLAGAAGVVWYLRTHHRAALLPLAIAAPAFLYLLSPQISGDAPWMLRRLSFAVVPVGIVYAAAWLAQLPRPHRLLASAVLAVCLLPATIAHLPLAENRGLLAQARAFGNRLMPDDIALIDRGTTGDGYAMIAGALHAIDGRNAAYIFNPADLARVDFGTFRNVYLVVPADDAARYTTDPAAAGLRFDERSRITMGAPRLGHSTAPWRWTPQTDTKTDNIVYRVSRR